MADDPNPDSGDVTDEGGGEQGEHSAQTSQDDTEVIQQEEAKIPLSRLNQVLDQNRTLSAEVATIKEDLAKANAPKKYTRAELSAAVEQETITQDKADTIMDSQLREEVVQEVTQSVASQTNTNRLNDLMGEFEKAIPDLLDDTSNTHLRVVQQYQRLLSYDMPNNVSTQLAAVEAVVGPLQALKSRPSAKGENPAYPESGGGDSGGGSDTPAETKWEGLSQRQKDHYTRAIDRGAYDDRDAVLKELNWSRPT